MSPLFDHQWMRPRRCGKRAPEIAGPYADHRSWPIAVPAPECRDVAHGRPWPRNDARDHSGSWKEYASRGADRRRGASRHVRDSAVDPVEGFFRSLVVLQWQWQSSMPYRWVWPQVALCHLLLCGTEKWYGVIMVHRQIYPQPQSYRSMLTGTFIKGIIILVRCDLATVCARFIHASSGGSRRDCWQASWRVGAMALFPDRSWPRTPPSSFIEGTVPAKQQSSVLLRIRTTAPPPAPTQPHVEVSDRFLAQCELTSLRRLHGIGPRCHTDGTNLS